MDKSFNGDAKQPLVSSPHSEERLEPIVLPVHHTTSSLRSEESQFALSDVNDVTAFSTRSMESLPVVSIYSPKAVFWTTFLLNILGGFVVSAINWSRLESPAKARTHIIIGAVIFIALTLLIAALPISGAVTLAVGGLLGWYLSWKTRDDIEQDAGIKRVEYANAWGAVGIGVACTVVMVILVLVLSPMMPHGS